MTIMVQFKFVKIVVYRKARTRKRFPQNTKEKTIIIEITVTSSNFNVEMIKSI